MEKYTELNCAFSLRCNTPENVIDTLLFMTGQDDEEPPQLPADPFFETKHWRQMLKGSGDGLDAEAYCRAALELSDTSGRYLVTIRCDLRHFDIEIARFISWITPHIFADKGDFVGYMRSHGVEPITVFYYPDRSVRRQTAFETRLLCSRTSW
jgi:hypothetical protein